MAQNMTQEQLLARIAELEAKLSAGNPLVQESVFVDKTGKGHVTYRVSVPGKMPFNLGRSKAEGVLRKDVQDALADAMKRPIPFDTIKAAEKAFAEKNKKS